MFTAAGIVLFRKFSNDFKCIYLVDQKGLDVPKGHKDDNESNIECAIRETYEEASILQESIKLLKKDMTLVQASPSLAEENLVQHDNSKLVCFVGITDSEPVVGVNPETGLKEHTECGWVSMEKMMSGCHDYLSSILFKSKKSIDKFRKSNVNI